MHQTNLIVCLGVICLTLASASAKELEGQVFVVTKGAQAIKLPLVPIMALRVDELQKHVSEIADKKNPECAKAESKTRASIEELQSARRGVSGGFGKWMMTLQKTQPKDPTGKAWADPRTEALRYNALEKEIPKLEARAANAGVQQKVICSAAPYFENLPQPVVTAKTDADGRFKLTAPDNVAIVIAARSQRQVFNTVENYFWMVRVKPTDSSVTLSNDNLTSSGSPDSIVSTKE